MSDNSQERVFTVPPSIVWAETSADGAPYDIQAIGVYNEDLAKVLSRYNTTTLAATQRFKAEPGTALFTATTADSGGGTIALVGLGDRTEAADNLLRDACAALSSSLGPARLVQIDVESFVYSLPDIEGQVVEICEGLLLGAYRFERYKAEDKRQPGPDGFQLFHTDSFPHAPEWLRRAASTVEMVYVARDLGNRVGSDLTAPEFAAEAERLAAESGFHAEVWDKARIEEEGLSGLLAVNRGSAVEPRFVTLKYEGRPTGPWDLALVGKGVTFDSGGLSLKPSDAMMGMKVDMAGAAVVLATIAALARNSSRARVLGFMPMTDNMPAGDALRVGDVVTYSDGTSVEVANTDAEGRLILADGLLQAGHYHPKLIIDLATLTGSCMVALGLKTAGLWATDDEIAGQVVATGKRLGEPIWQLPLLDDVRKTLESPIASMRNIPTGRWGDAIAAATFLREFVDKSTPWIHLDMAGPADSEDGEGLCPKGATGFGVRTLVEFAERLRLEA